MKTIRSFFVLFCILAFACVAQATTVIPPTFDELVNEAELIFQGTVTNVTSQWTGEGARRHIESYVTVNVEDPIKGNPGASYTLSMLGGTVDGETMEVSDSPKFKIGDRDVLFVEHNGTQFIPLVGIMHGRFRVQKDTLSGAEVVLNDEGKALTDVTQLGKGDEHTALAAKNSSTANAPAASAMNAADFKAAIRAKLAQAVR